MRLSAAETTRIRIIDRLSRGLLEIASIATSRSKYAVAIQSNLDNAGTAN
jgi:hypothetical protein